MLRLLITLLACLMFLIFGQVGEGLLNLVAYKHEKYLPDMTQFVIQSFPLNSLYFFDSVFPFGAAMFIVLILTSSKKPIIAPSYFSEGVLLILILFGLYFGFFLLAIIVPFHLMGMVIGRPLTSLNIAISLVNYALWFTVAVLLVWHVISRKKP